MSLRLKNKKLIRYIFILTISPLLVILLFFWAKGSIWTIWDYQILDLVYKQATEHGYGPEMSHKIVYLPITDNTYKYFGRNILDRADKAMVNDALANGEGFIPVGGQVIVVICDTIADEQDNIIEIRLPPTVGGEILSVNTLELVAPFLLLSALVVAGIVGVLFKHPPFKVLKRSLK